MQSNIYVCCAYSNSTLTNKFSYFFYYLEKSSHRCSISLPVDLIFPQVNSKTISYRRVTSRVQSSLVWFSWVNRGKSSFYYVAGTSGVMLAFITIFIGNHLRFLFSCKRHFIKCKRILKVVILKIHWDMKSDIKSLKWRKKFKKVL